MKSLCRFHESDVVGSTKSCQACEGLDVAEVSNVTSTLAQRRGHRGGQDRPEDGGAENYSRDGRSLLRRLDLIIYPVGTYGHVSE